MGNPVKILSVRLDLDGRSLNMGDGFEPVGIAGTVVRLTPSDGVERASVRMPDGAPVEVAAARKTEDGYELVFHQPLPPGTRIHVGGDTVLRLPDTALVR